MVHDIRESGDLMVEVGAEVDEAIKEVEINGLPDSVMAFNLAEVSDEERTRVYCRRFGYCNSLLLKKMSEDENFGKQPKLIDLNEDNAIMDAEKFRRNLNIATIQNCQWDGRRGFASMWMGQDGT